MATSSTGASLVAAHRPAGHRTRWRDDIQLLRAIAVVVVILFHLGLLPGGYLGVDLFFVISGYLIGSQIRQECRDGRFSLIGFYARRLRRLMPVFVTVSLTTAAAGWFLDDPAQFQDLGRALAAASLLAANIYFYGTIDYFHQAGVHNPLLHDWSLGVEEQFYLVFPACLMLLLRRSARMAGIAIAAAGAASVIASALATHDHPAATFYLLPFRIFEFSTGALLAVTRTAQLRAGARDVAALGGLALIVASLAILPRFGSFPGAFVAIPCLGTATVLWAGRDAMPSALSCIARPPLVRLGRISYSLYMVHWPIIVFGDVALGTVSDATRVTILLVCIVGAASLCFHAIEQPLRRSRIAVPVGSLLALALTFSIGATIGAHAGFPSRFRGLEARYLSYLSYDPRAQFRTGRCFLELDREAARLDTSVCLPTPEPGMSLAVLWGDSTAADLWWGLRDPMLRHHDILGQVIAASCPPAVGYDPPNHPFCRGFNAAAIDLILRARPALVLLSWDGAQTDFPGLAATIGRLRSSGSRVVLVGVTPFYDLAVPRILAGRAARSDPDRTSGHDLVSWSIEGDEWRRYFAAQNHVGFASITGTLCPAGRCPLLTPSGVPIEFDPLHFTRAGSRLVGGILAPEIFGSDATPLPRALPRASAP